ncbi:MAG TPA: methylthioribulose 1-phosphate dehydratase [Polyangiaceae bacterium]
MTTEDLTGVDRAALGADAPSFERLGADLAEVGRALRARGWLEATSGNLSARLEAGDVAMTRSGRDKGRLGPDDVLRVSVDGEVLTPPGARPSAEALLHLQIYRHRSDVRAVLHVHAPNATILSRQCVRDGSVTLTGYEMLKALPGVETHEHTEVVPIFPNTQDMSALAREVDLRLDWSRASGYLIAGHGLYAWGADLERARTVVEAYEFLFDCELRSRRIKR